MDILAALFVIGLVIVALFVLRIILAWAFVIVPPLCGLALGIWVLWIGRTLRTPSHSFLLNLQHYKKYSSL